MIFLYPNFSFRFAIRQRLALLGVVFGLEIIQLVVFVALPAGAAPVAQVSTCNNSNLVFSTSSEVAGSVLYITPPPGARAQIQAAFSVAEDGAKSPIPPQELTLGATRILRGLPVTPISFDPSLSQLSQGRIEVVIVFIFDNSANSAKSDYRPSHGFMKNVFQSIVVNYECALGWYPETLAPPSERMLASARAVVDPFAVTDQWWKIGVGSTGVVRVTGATLNSAGLASPIMTNDLRIFYAGGQQLPVLNTAARPSFEEIPLKVVDGGDGRLDPADYILFYGESPNRWLHIAGAAPRFQRNIYTNENSYWLTVASGFPTSAMRISAVSGAPSGLVGAAVTASRRHLRLESDRMLSTSGGDVFDYYRWYWFSQSPTTISSATPDAVKDASIDDTTYFTMRAIAGSAGLTIGTTPTTATSNFSQHMWSFKTDATISALSSLTVQASKYFGSGPFVDYLEVNYLARFSVSSDFVITGLNSRHLFSVTGAQNGAVALNVSDPRNPIEITGSQLVGGALSFEADVRDTAINRFQVTNPVDFATPTSISFTQTHNLRADTLLPIDMFVIAPRQWSGNLDRYIAHRSQRSGASLRFVAIEDIYDNFGYGTPDPTAIRDFLRFAYLSYPSPQPSTVLFVGDGSYDFRNVTGANGANFLPPYTMILDDGMASDDNYVYFGDYGYLDSDTNYIPDSVFGVDMIPARWSVRNTAELERVISKTIAYEDTPEFGPWRATVSLVADDEFGHFVNEAVHVQQTEELEKNYLPRVYHRDKIYLWDYPLNSLRRRPTCNDAIVRAINDGVLILNYVGHGNPALFADERVFTQASDLPRLQNGGRLPLIFTASCSIGFFDEPSGSGMGEDLLRMSGGAVAVVSATRLVYSSANALFNRVAYGHLFSDRGLSMCQAMYAAKLTRQTPGGTVDNDRRYSFFGDPLLALGSPALTVVLDNAPDSVMALSPATVSGHIATAAGAPVSLNGVVQIAVYDSETKRNHQVLDANGQLSADVNYSVTGPVIFKGVAPVVSGAFSFTYVAPLDVGYGGAGARIEVYFVGDTTDGVGIVDSLPVGATIPTISDNLGPEIRVSFPNRANFMSGDPVGANDELVVTLRDTSGINLTGVAGHALTLTVDGDLTTTSVLNSSFIYDQGSFRTGRASTALNQLSSGTHTFKIKAWDNANNSSVYEFGAEVVSAESFALRELLNYPNPMTSHTGFYFTLPVAAERVSLKIFTLSGRLIFQDDERDLAAGYYADRLSWNGVDSDGDRVATGVYIYQITAESTASGLINENGKIVVLN